MNQSMKKLENALLRASTVSLLNRFSRAAFALVGIMILMSITAVPARAAGCAPSGRQDDVIALPDLNNGTVSAPATIVGLWQVTYTTSSKAPFGVSFKEWHSDGTEFENIDHSPVIGNICFGVWKQVGARAVRLHHTGWLFDDNGNPIGSFIIEETDSVWLSGMTYSGSFVFRVYDKNGDYVSGSEITGTMIAKRITVN
ncbi:MAG: hypothetical protein WA419_15625 [Silvibacterium sp.]